MERRARPADKNGLGRTIEQTERDVQAIESSFTILPDGPAIYPEWRRLVVAHSVLGKQVHDARLVAAMNVNRITDLLTFNGDDFKRFPNITIIDPAAV
ncbi:MAG: type II toxin-antitoxin system VapC family toxin [Pyrinomonadaceae bacterium]